jgi:hypothetical protein
MKATEAKVLARSTQHEGEYKIKGYRRAKREIKSAAKQGFYGITGIKYNLAPWRVNLLLDRLKLDGFDVSYEKLGEQRYSVDIHWHIKEDDE